MPALGGFLQQLQHSSIICISQPLANSAVSLRCGAMLLVTEGRTVHSRIAMEHQQTLHHCHQTM